jgi:endonuclease/exonuclease/phosphatase family metal-dependent hydrolase
MKRLLIVILSILILGVFSAPIVADSDFAHLRRYVKVMTQNLYVGADLERIAETQQQQDDNPYSVPMAVGEVFQTVLDTNFKERAEAMAAEIGRLRPDLIGLQEVFRITVEPLSDPSDPNYPPPPIQVYDYLSDLLAVLQKHRLPYKVAATIMNANAPLSRITGAELDTVRFIDRDVILVRKNIDISNATARNFRTDLAVEGQTVWRGFVAVDATVRGKTFRFVNTHLEVRGEGPDNPISAFQAEQARELIVELRDEKRPVIVVGDLNSSPQDQSKVTSILTPYTQFIEAGYVDTWHDKDAGFTCCQAEDLLNADSMLDERIDLVLVRNAGGSFFTTGGDKPQDKTPSGLWPSDHAGVFARIFSPSRF